MSQKTVKRFICTGTPSSGKTSLLQQLKQMNYIVIEEAATDFIIAEQSKGMLQPWNEPGFTDKIVLLQQTRQLNALGNLQFYDRSPFCTYALSKYLAINNNTLFTPSLTLSQEIERCLESNIYQAQVFFLENLGFITPSEVRQINYQQALIFEQIHLEVYKSFGFELIMVAKDTISARCDFVLNLANSVAR